jgi:hypothetical protein
MTAVSQEDAATPTINTGTITNGMALHYVTASSRIRMQGNPACLYIQGTASAQTSVVMNY